MRIEKVYPIGSMIVLGGKPQVVFKHQDGGCYVKPFYLAEFDFKIRLQNPIEVLQFVDQIRNLIPLEQLSCCMEIAKQFDDFLTALEIHTECFIDQQQTFEKAFKGEQK